MSRSRGTYVPLTRREAVGDLLSPASLRQEVFQRRRVAIALLRVDKTELEERQGVRALRRHRQQLRPFANASFFDGQWWESSALLAFSGGDAGPQAAVDSAVSPGAERTGLWQNASTIDGSGLAFGTDASGGLSVVTLSLV